MRQTFLGFLAIVGATWLAGCQLLPKTNPATGEGAPEPSEELVDLEVDAGGILEEAPVKMRDPRPLWKRVLFFWQRGPQPPKASALVPIAKVFSVNTAGGFAIVESMAAASIQPGTQLCTISNGVVTSVLRVTPDRRPPFLIADFVTGIPSSGDSLYAVE
jgi:hypothetical protein